MHFIKTNLKYLILLLVLVFVVYANALPAEFVSDDIASYLNNPNLGSYDLSLNFPHSWFNSAIFDLFGRSPFAFRLFNVIFHLANTILVFVIVNYLHKKKEISFLVAAIFATHPILVESVTWISGGIYAQSTFFALLSFLLYILPDKFKLKYFIPSFISFLIALTFSEKVIVLPGIVFVYELCFGSLKKKWKHLLPYFGLSVLWFALNFLKIGQRTQALAQNFYSNPVDHNPLLQIPIAISYYFQLLLWPDKLSIYQTEMFFSPFEFWVRVGVLGLFLISLLFTLIKKRKYFFWLALFVIALLPTLTPLGLAWIVAERYVYFGSIGIIVVFVLLWHALNEKFYADKKMYWIVGIIIVLALASRTYVRNQDWQNHDTLWPATVKVAPSGHNIHNNMGDVYGRAGDKDRAIAEFSIAIAINPRYGDAMHNLASTYIEVGEVDKAIFWYNQALKNGPHLWQSAQNLGLIYFQLGELDMAEEYLIYALQLNPTSEGLQKNLQLITDAKNQAGVQ